MSEPRGSESAPEPGSALPLTPVRAAAANGDAAEEPTPPSGVRVALYCRAVGGFLAIAAQESRRGAEPSEALQATAARLYPGFVTVVDGVPRRVLRRFADELAARGREVLEHIAEQQLGLASYDDLARLDDPERAAAFANGARLCKDMAAEIARWQGAPEAVAAWGERQREMDSR